MTGEGRGSAGRAHGGPPSPRGGHTSPRTELWKPHWKYRGPALDEGRFSRPRQQRVGGLRGEGAEHIKENGGGQWEAREVDVQIMKGFLRPVRDLGLHPKGHEKPLKNFRRE